MNHQCGINALTGDVIKYYSNIRGAIKKETIADPNRLTYEINLESKKEDTTTICITDGFISEFDHLELNSETKVPEISKTIKIRNAKYAVIIKYTKVATKYINIKVNIFAIDQNTMDKLYGSIPTDIYFF